MEISGRIKSYLKEKQYPEFVWQGGIERLLTDWKNTVRNKNNKVNFYGWDDFLNDLDGRRILEEVLDEFKNEDLSELKKSLKEIDDLYKERSIFSELCVYRRELAEKYHYTPNKHWWYYRIPKSYYVHYKYIPLINDNPNL
jgi:hypothetical protein